MAGSYRLRSMVSPELILPRPERGVVKHIVLELLDLVGAVSGLLEFVGDVGECTDQLGGELVQVMRLPSLACISVLMPD
jgi:hypothetical protein